VLLDDDAEANRAGSSDCSPCTRIIRRQSPSAVHPCRTTNSSTVLVPPEFDWVFGCHYKSLPDVSLLRAA